jgi:hypothetical protein
VAWNIASSAVLSAESRKTIDDNNTFFVSAAEEKNMKSKELGITHFLDDEKNVIDILTDVPQKFWLDVFNIFKDGDTYTRVVSWDEFLKKVYGY